MAIEMQGKFYQDGKTVVMLRDREGGADFSFNATLDGNRENDTLQELISAAMEQLKARYFAETAILEMEEKVKNLVSQTETQLNSAGQKIAKIDDTLERAEIQYRRMEISMKSMLETVMELVDSLENAEKGDVNVTEGKTE